MDALGRRPASLGLAVCLSDQKERGGCGFRLSGRDERPDKSERPVESRGAVVLTHAPIEGAAVVERYQPSAETVLGTSAAMLLRIDDPSLTADLCIHFRRAGFSAEAVGEGRVLVNRSDASNPDQEGREIELHLRDWLAMNAAAVEMLPDH
jgi:hypothetical protein